MYLENNKTSDFINAIYYGISKQILDKLLDKELISQCEYNEIDILNSKSFRQFIDSIANNSG